MSPRNSTVVIPLSFVGACVLEWGKLNLLFLLGLFVGETATH